MNNSSYINKQIIYVFAVLASTEFLRSYLSFNIKTMMKLIPGISSKNKPINKYF